MAYNKNLKRKIQQPLMRDYDKEMNEQESLALITEMIDKARNHFHESGASAILWGAVVSFCGFVSFVQKFWKFSIGFDVWILTLIAVVPQVLISIKENRRKAVRTHTEAALDAVWAVYALSIFGLVIYANVIPFSTNYLLEKYDGVRLWQETIATGSVKQRNAFVPSFSSLMLLIYAFPTMCTGIIERFRPMMIGAILCYVFFIASLFTTSTWDYLFMGVAGIFNWLIPGIILRKRYLRAAHV